MFLAATGVSAAKFKAFGPLVAGFFMLGRIADMQRYGLKDLLMAMTFIVVGLSLLAWLIRHAPLGDDLSNIPIFLICWFGGGAMIGAGVSVPFRQMRRGAVVGALVQVGTIIVMNVLGIA